MSGDYVSKNYIVKNDGEDARKIYPNNKALKYNKTANDVIIIGIDQASYENIGQFYPYDRGSIWSKTVNNLVDAGVSVIIFDIMFDRQTKSDSIFSESIKRAEDKGIKVILAAAGGAAHLAGVTAAHTPIPVLGIPMESKLSGLDSLLSTVQMPSGVPVATFAIGSSGSKNAALFAIRIIALEDNLVANKLDQYIKKMEKEVPEKPK